MKKLLLLIAVALLTSIATMAQPRSEQQAIQIAQDFFATSTKKKAPKLSVVSQQKVTQQIRKKVASAKKAPAQHSSCYIINDEANNRFVIVSADERMYKILGYSDNGCFDAEKAPDALIEMIGQYRNQFNFLLQNGNQALANNIPQKVAPIGPLLQTKWDQGSPYNDECPYDKSWEQIGINLRSVTGCAATAMAQIMNYHKYPQHGEGNLSYVTKEGIEQEMNLSSFVFDWDNISNEYNSNSTDIQKQAVAQLMHACGLSIRMEYSFLKSTAATIDVAYAMTHYFNYNPNLKYYQKKFFSNTEWNSIIINDLRLGLPVFYGGQTKTYDENGNVQKDDDGKFITGGHGFVIDGCDENLLYHINFGYSGEYDGYYSLEAISLKENVNYELDQEMICNISKNEIGTKEDVFFASDLEMYESTQSSWFSLSLEKEFGESVIFVYSPQNWCVSSNSYDQPFIGEYGIGLFDLNYNFITYLKKNTVYSFTQWYSGSVYNSKNDRVYFDRSTFKEGNQYIIAPYAKSSGSEKTTVMRTIILNSYLAIVEDGKVKISLYSEPASILSKDMQIASSGTAKLQIGLDNVNTSYRGFLFDLKLPQGLTIVKESDESFAAELSNRCSGENIEFYVSNKEDNIYSFSVLNTEISAGQGTLMEITVASSNLPVGDYIANVSNFYMVKPNGMFESVSNYNISINVLNSELCFGDANGDGDVDVADIVYLVNYIMESPAADFKLENADMNSDGEIDVADITLIVKLIMESSVKVYKPSILSAQGIDFNVNASGEYTLSVNEAENFVATQFDVVISDGAVLEEIAMIQKGNHQLTYSQIGDNRYRVIAYSPSNEPIDKEFLTFHTKGHDGIVSIENALFVHQNGEKLAFEKLSGQATGLTKISNGYQGRSIYSIDGREISRGTMSKGLYIINGKKHIVK